MGGTTAKICLIDQGRPQSSRTFEVARVYRFMKGSGLPLRIPVIEVVEIGAGGGSIASVDSLKRIAVGPRSAGRSEEHTSELQSLMRISYAVFCLKKKKSMTIEQHDTEIITRTHKHNEK